MFIFAVIYSVSRFVGFLKGFRKKGVERLSLFVLEKMEGKRKGEREGGEKEERGREGRKEEGREGKYKEKIKII